MDVEALLRREAGVGLMAGLARDQLMAFLYYMRLQRAIEDRISKLYLQGRIVGGCYIGYAHEAIGVGSAFALEEDDILYPLQRDMGARLVRGMTPLRIFAQFLGRRSGPSRGKDGNVHYGDLALNMIPMISMLGASIPVAAGAALAMKLRGEARVVLAYIGDGGTNTGDFHEGMNLAAVQKVPLVVIAENNCYAYSTPSEKHLACKDIASRARAYDIPGEIVDGNDVLAVHALSRRAVAHARSSEGPFLIEAKTFRVKGHSVHDDAAYVPRGKIEEWAKRDPIARFERLLLEQEVASQAELAELSERVTHEVEQAAAEAERQPLPEASELLEGVYRQPISTATKLGGPGSTKLGLGGE